MATIPTRTTSQKFMTALRIYKRAVEKEYFSIIAIYAGDISNYEMILDKDVNI